MLVAYRPRRARHTPSAALLVVLVLAACVRPPTRDVAPARPADQPGPTEQSVSVDSASADPPGLPDLPGLVAFWDFQEPPGAELAAAAGHAYTLEEMNGPIARATDGVFGPRSLDLAWGQWLRASTEQAPGLDLHGEDEVTIVAWVKRESDRVWQFIAGVWDEGEERFRGQPSASGPGAPARQYALFMSGWWQNDHTTYERTRAEHQAMGYVSPSGGATPGHPFAFDYATGGTFLEKGRWYMLAYTFDGAAIRVYVDGALDGNGNANPFLYDGPIHDGPADFTVALRRVPKWPAYPEGVPENEAGFDGRLGGLAVYDRALTDEEMALLYRTTMTRGS